MRALAAAAIAAAGCGGVGPHVADPTPSFEVAEGLVVDRDHRLVSCGDDTVHVPSSLSFGEQSDATVIATSPTAAMRFRAWSLSIDATLPVLEWLELHERIAGGLPHELRVTGAANREESAVVAYLADGRPFRYAFGSNLEATCTVAALERDAPDAEVVAALVGPGEPRWTYEARDADEPTLAMVKALKSIAQP